jgi:hypothetical protein
MAERFVPLTPQWEYVADRVMGGVSTGALSVEDVAGRAAARLTGRVSLENNGGFIQMAFDTAHAGSGVDPAAWTGLFLDVYGNGERYDVRLRTTDLERPWQSFRAEIEAQPLWRTILLPFDGFVPHRTQASFNPGALRRVGILAAGRAFEADVAVARVGVYG